MINFGSHSELVNSVKQYTGSTNDDEIKLCISLAEAKMRNVELPTLRSDPYAASSIGVADHNGFISIPTDMQKPIQFFMQGTQFTQTLNCTGSANNANLQLLDAPNRPLIVGMSVFGNGIADGAKISSILNNTVTLSANNTATVSGLITFSTDPTSTNSTTSNGSWILYDRRGERSGIADQARANATTFFMPLGITPIRGSFAEAGPGAYSFLPALSEGALVNMYYYRSFNQLGTITPPTFIDSAGNVTAVVNNSDVPPTYNVTLTVDDTSLLYAGGYLTMIGSGLTNQDNVILTVNSPTSVTVKSSGNTGIPVVGPVTQIYYSALITSNELLNSVPEAYFYGTLSEYYSKNNNLENMQKYTQMFLTALGVIAEENQKGKNLGGSMRIISRMLPRARYYSTTRR